MWNRFFKWLLTGCAVMGTLYVLLTATGWMRFYRTPTSAMEPTIRGGDCLVATRPLGDVRHLKRGTLVIFDPSSVSTPRMPLEGLHLKRIAGLPGDRIERMDNELLVNGQRLAERGGLHPMPPAPSTMRVTQFPLVVPEGRLFLLGDNYANSLDSRYFGTVPVEAVQKISRFRVWPLSRFGRIE